MATASTKYSTVVTLNVVVAVMVILYSAYGIVAGFQEAGSQKAFLPLAGIVFIQALLVVVTAWKSIAAFGVEPVHATPAVWNLNVVVLGLGFAQGFDLLTKSQVNFAELTALVVGALALLNIACLVVAAKSSAGTR